VPPDNEFLQIAQKSGHKVSSQIEVFFQLCPAYIIGITGANGKSTTTALTAHLLRGGLGKKGCKYRQVWLGGNIGNEPLLMNLGSMHADDLVVLELSSFQLEQLARIRKVPAAALLTNLTPNHLDRHGTFDAYCAAKENIFSLQRLDARRPAVSVFNGEDEIAAAWFDKYSKDKGRVCLKFNADDVSEKVRSRFKLAGRMNLSNLAGAMALASQFGVTEEIVAGCVASFKSLPHRLELVADVRGVRWFNDSIATTPVSVIAALEAFDEPKIIIAGGHDKHLPFDDLGRAMAKRAKAVVLIGQTAPQIAEALKKCPDSCVRVEMAKTLEEAVQKADSIAQPGDVVLLSPACASYDMFRNFQHRGEEFRTLAARLRS
jgi:UDP-N-acetylmuramoylalanine--D-glutamate ligase